MKLSDVEVGEEYRVSEEYPDVAFHGKRVLVVDFSRFSIPIRAKVVGMEEEPLWLLYENEIEPVNPPISDTKE